MATKMLAGIGEGTMVLTEIPAVRLMSRKVRLKGEDVTLYGIGHMALHLKRSTATIRRWQRAGVILPPIVATTDKVRWYLKEEIEIYLRLMRKYNLQTGLDIEKTGFPQEANAEIQKLRRTLA